MTQRKPSRKSDAGVLKERFSLNPKLAEDDKKAFDVVLADPISKENLELVWFAVLKSGDCLKKEKCDMKHFLTFAKEAKYATNEKSAAAAQGCADVQVGEDDCLDFPGFVKTLFHMGMEKFHTQDYSVAFNKMMENHVLPFYTQFKASQEHDGTGPDDSLLDIPEIDRILYVYDGVFDRLFNRYRDRADHANRELSLDQLKILDTLVELDEMRYLLQDFGFFPKFISHVEISKCCQFSCFGKLVVDPTRLGPAYRSSIEASKRDQGNVPSIVAVGEELPPADEAKVSNPLFLPTLPPEYLTDEVLLDKPRFMCCLLRIAQALFGRSEFTKRLPSIPSRVEELLVQMAPIYDKMFGRTMDQDCDFTEKGVPILNSDGPHAALAPHIGPMTGGFELAISGTNFCEKRGVFVRFGEGEEAVVVRAKLITKKKVFVITPPMKPRDTVVSVHFHHKYRIELVKETTVTVECSNNRWVYSLTEPPQILTFQTSLPHLELPESVSSKLLKFFSAICAINDRYNTKFLYREKWKTVKSMYKVIEVSPAEDANDMYFLERAEYPEGAKDMCLTFKTYLRVLARSLYAMHGDGWADEILKLADVSFQPQAKLQVVAQKFEEDDLTAAKRALEMVERRANVEVDVFLGPVLCGTIRSLPGDIVSSCSGRQVLIRKSHPFFSYEHFEINSESSVMNHIKVSQSFQHLQNRLMSDGYDFSCRHHSPSLCRPSGRCWEIRNASGERIGALWDYAGNYSNLEWQPAEQDMTHSSITMCIYKKDSEVEFLQGYLVYHKAKDIGQIRTLLTSKQFQLFTKLYRLP